jgi:hypothetical protein
MNKMAFELIDEDAPELRDFNTFIDEVDTTWNLSVMEANKEIAADIMGTHQGPDMGEVRAMGRNYLHYTKPFGFRTLAKLAFTLRNLGEPSAESQASASEYASRPVTHAIFHALIDTAGQTAVESREDIITLTAGEWADLTRADLDKARIERTTGMSAKEISPLLGRTATNLVNQSRFGIPRLMYARRSIPLRMRTVHSADIHA